jgi:tetratricopeptide (TPR) repeat protein
MRRRGGSEIRPPDALLEALGQLVDSALSRHALGVDASLVGNWAAAADHFRRVIALEPDHVSAHVNLAVALHRVGDSEGALAEAIRALEISPTEARAQYVRGAILAEGGRDAEAIRVYMEAIRVNPDFVEAHLNLALLLRRNGRLQEALARYAAALSLQPALAEAQFGSGNVMARLGRFREARDRFSEGMAAHPDDARFAHALARVLASAPDATVRDGRRALALIEGLLAEVATVDRVTTMALTLAELGRYDEAAGWQREALAGAARAGETGRAVLGMERNLLAFQQRRPVRQAWAEDEQSDGPARAAPVPRPVEAR